VTADELRRFDTIAVRIATAAGITTDKETRRKLLSAAMTYEKASNFFRLPRSVGRTDPLERAAKSIRTLRLLKADPFAEYYLARSLYILHRETVATEEGRVDERADHVARILGDHARIEPTNPWDGGLDLLSRILDGARFLALGHKRHRGDSKVMVAERYAVFHLALIWKQAKEATPSFDRAPSGTGRAPERQVLKRTGFNSFALDFLEAVGATVGNEFVCDTWGDLQKDGAEDGEAFNPESERSWQGLRCAVDTFDRLFLNV